MIKRSARKDGDPRPLDPHDVEEVIRTLRDAVESERFYGTDRIAIPEGLGDGISFRDVVLPEASPETSAPSSAVSGPKPSSPPSPEKKPRTSTGAPTRSATIAAYPQIALETREQELAAMARKVAQCSACRLHTQRRQTVFADGPVGARLMLVGEGPGADEDRQGVPFVGKAGQLLDKIIQAMGLGRENVYIANVVKCRPPGNRTPQADEVARCFPYLQRQIELVQPEVIGALGTPALQALLKLNTSMARARGRVFRYGPARVVPTYHPAYLLRQPHEKIKVWQDVQVMMKLLGLPLPNI